MSICLDNILAMVRGTDRWMELVKQYCALHAIHVDVIKNEKLTQNLFATAYCVNIATQTNN